MLKIVLKIVLKTVLRESAKLRSMSSWLGELGELDELFHRSYSNKQHSWMSSMIQHSAGFE